MRVAISTSVIQRGKSGVGQYLLALVRALLDRPGRRDLVLFVLEQDLPLFGFASGRAEIVAVPERFRPAVRNIAWHQAVLPSLVRRLQIDVLHVPSYRRMLASHPCALVATIHDLAPFHVRAKYDLARMFYGRVVVKHLARRQDQVIAISGNTARDIERFFGIPASRQNIILNGIDHARFLPGPRAEAKAEAASRWQLGAPFFLFISRLEHPAKNHVRLIEAFNRFKDKTGSPWLLALGGSDWHGADVVRAAAAQSPFAKDIRFLGFVDDAALPGLYRAADAMVYPSLFEGFGLPPAEAMACGCPVLSSSRGSLAEVVADAADLIEPEDVASITAGLKRMASDQALRERLTLAGLANARRFDWDANAARVLEVYRAALERRPVAA
ncbi:MAG: glycosyltransferase family 1 protein [Verrucomicrobiota bacterium]